MSCVCVILTDGHRLHNNKQSTPLSAEPLVGVLTGISLKHMFVIL